MLQIFKKRMPLDQQRQASLILGSEIAMFSKENNGKSMPIPLVMQFAGVFLIYMVSRDTRKTYGM
ncbi:MAG TPA: hypothetical protein DD982_05885 [Thalassospira sp.]|nr:hypothetical protein [Thalassospira sp.]MBA06036.1 hypothetical protein [Thalassospira sp.]HBN50456.1 hypothetical protein [Thalassospira sp.]HBS22045.1 hypothetical protein [Thalassospira sp.]